MLSDRLGRASEVMSVLCYVGRKTLIWPVSYK